MGRHSAPADDDDEPASAPVATSEADPSGAAPGRHSASSLTEEIRPHRPLAPRAPRRPTTSKQPTALRPEPRRRPLSSPPTAVTGPVPRIPPELPVERTLAISAVEAEVAADADSADAPVLDTVPPEQLDPIRPGEAISPPRPGGLSTLHDLLDETAGSATDVVVDPAPLVDDASDIDQTAAGVVEAEAPDQPSPVGAAPAADVPEVAAPEVAAPDVAKADLAEADAGRAAGSAADFALLRSNSSLFARCLAGLLVPFAIYIIAMAVLGASGRQWLIWIWIPMITAGVLVGAFLDHGHKTTPSDAAESSVSRS